LGLGFADIANHDALVAWQAERPTETDMKRVIHDLPAGFSLPDRIEGEAPTVRIGQAPRADASAVLIEPREYEGDIWVSAYKKVRGQDVWLLRTDAEIDAAISKIAARRHRAYLWDVELPDGMMVQ
jgi:hypothetical protein